MNETTNSKNTNNNDSIFIEEDDWGLSSTSSKFLTGFSQHYQITIPLSSPLVSSLVTSTNDTTSTHIPSSSSSSYIMTLNCVESLTPLDMMNLYNGNHDSTGHRLWMGSLFFMECFACTLPPTSSSLSLSDERQESNIMIDTLSKWRTKLFHHKRILELGAGTGASGLSLIIAGNNNENNNNNNNTLYYPQQQPYSVTFTDSDEGVLYLCIKNMKQNNIQLFGADTSDVNDLNNNNNNNDYNVVKQEHKVYQLEWGYNNQNIHNNSITVKRYNATTQPSLSSSSHDETTTTATITTETICIHSFDCIIATDVIYDISAIKPLFETASLLLKNNGYFILSHIPRATASEEEDNGHNNIQDKIETLILNIAKSFHFDSIHMDGFGDDDDHNHNCCIRPKDLLKIRNKMISSNTLDYNEMEMVGAGIFIFKYNGCC